MLLTSPVSGINVYIYTTLKPLTIWGNTQEALCVSDHFYIGISGIFLNLLHSIPQLCFFNPTPTCCVALGPCWNAEVVHFGVSPGFRAGWSYKRITKAKWVQKDNRLCADNAIEVGLWYLGPPCWLITPLWWAPSHFDLESNTLTRCLCERNPGRRD